MNSMTFLAIGIVLLVLLWAVGRRQGIASVRSGAAPDASEYLVRLPPSGLLGRCFAEDDFGFVAGLGSRDMARLLVRERRRLALEWLRLTRREAKRLFGLHIRAVRFAADLRPAAEFQFLAQACAFLLTYEVLAALVWFYGPFRARAYAQSIEGLGSVLAALGSAIAQSVRGAGVRKIEPIEGN